MDHNVGIATGRGRQWRVVAGDRDRGAAVTGWGRFVGDGKGEQEAARRQDKKV